MRRRDRAVIHGSTGGRQRRDRRRGAATSRGALSLLRHDDSGNVATGFLRVLTLLAAFVAVALVAGVLAAGLVLPAAAGAGYLTRSGSDYYDDLPTELEIPPVSQTSRMVAADGSLIATFFSENRTQHLAQPDGRVGPQGHRRRRGRAVLRARRGRHPGHPARAGQQRPRRLPAGRLDAHPAVRQAGAAGVGRLLRRPRGAAPGSRPRSPRAGRRATAASCARPSSPSRSRSSSPRTRSSSATSTSRTSATRRTASRPRRSGTSASTPSSSPCRRPPLLAGIVQAPTRWDPLDNPEGTVSAATSCCRGCSAPARSPSRSTTRPSPPIWRWRRGRPSEAASPPASWRTSATTSQRSSSATPPTARPRRRENLLLRGGLRIETTINRELQARAWDAVRSQVPETDRAGVAMSVVQPGTGQILAMAQNRTCGFDPEDPGADDGQLQRRPALQRRRRLPARVEHEAHRPGDLAGAGRRPQRPGPGAAAARLPLRGLHRSAGSRCGATTRPTRSATPAAPRRPCASPRRRSARATPPTSRSPAARPVPHPRHGHAAGAAPRDGPGRRDRDAADHGARLRRGRPAVGGQRLRDVRRGRRALQARSPSRGSRPDRRGPAGPVRRLHPGASTRRSPAASTRRCSRRSSRARPTSSTSRGVAAGKTGTTNDFNAVWFSGYIPNLAASVWVGDPGTDGTPQPPHRVPHQRASGCGEVFGSTVALPTWDAFMNRVGEVYDIGDDGFPEPDEDICRGRSSRARASRAHEAQAEATLEAPRPAGRRRPRSAGSPTTCRPGDVVAQSPSSGALQRDGATVTLYLSRARSRAPRRPRPTPAPADAVAPAPRRRPPPTRRRRRRRRWRRRRRRRRQRRRRRRRAGRTTTEPHRGARAAGGGEHPAARLHSPSTGCGAAW